MPPGQPGGPAARLGDADRDRLIALLREHYALGRLDLDQLSSRVETVLAAEYAHQAAAALADLPPSGPGQAAGPGSAAGPARKARRCRHAQSAAPGAGWVPTSERFRDPATGTIMRVWLDPADQSRHYVPDTGPD